MLAWEELFIRPIIGLISLNQGIFTAAEGE
jgi:hypothetical protein